MVQIAHGWELEVERGPDWLFVTPRCQATDATEMPPLAEQVWALLEQQFTHNLVLELQEIEFLGSYLIGQLVWLHKRVHTHGGLMRICGLSSTAQDVLHQCRLDSRFPQFSTRNDAVMGYRPMQPR